MKAEQVKQILSKSSLSSEDFAALEKYEPNHGTNKLYSFFTPIWLCEVMYQLAIKNGFPKDGKILEPACGTGNFLTVLDHPENCTAFELDPLNYEVAKARSPKTKIYNQYFETNFLQAPRYTTKLKKPITWLEDYPFDLVIGNPPYGEYKGLYKPHFKSLKIKQFETFFMYKSMELLTSGGLMVFITASGFMRSASSYRKEKTMLAKYAEFVDAYRMPKVFKNTDVPTDILIFRKK
jgi:type I restriction-modification system DNA methylase subunit